MSRFMRMERGSKKVHLPFLLCAEVVLPWLPPKELASISLTCKTLNAIANSITLSRSLDASRSLENLPIPFSNSIDQKRYSYFLYSPSRVILSSGQRPCQPWGSGLRAVCDSSSGFPADYETKCGRAFVSELKGPIFYDKEEEKALLSLIKYIHPNCSNSGSPSGFCQETELGQASLAGYDDDAFCNGSSRTIIEDDSHSIENSRCTAGSANSFSYWESLVDELREIVCGCWCEQCEEIGNNGESACPCYSLRFPGIMSECGPGCDCGTACENRLTQEGISVRLKIVRDERKGWALYTDQAIKQGQFICEYADYSGVHIEYLGFLIALAPVADEATQ